MKLRAFLLLLVTALLTSATRAEVATPEATAKALLTYLFSGKHDLATDRKAQERWLTKSLREEVAKSLAAASKLARAKPDERIDLPDSGTFLNAWDGPTSFQILDSKITPPKAEVNLRYTWGPKTNYPGETRNVTVLFVLEGGAWRVDDIRNQKSKFSNETTLRKDLHELTKQ